MNIKPGQNLLIRRNLIDYDGVTPLPIASLAALSASLSYNGRELFAYTYPDAALRDGETSSQFVLEVSREVSNALPRGVEISIAYTVGVVDPNFAIDGDRFTIFYDTLIIN